MLRCLAIEGDGLGPHNANDGGILSAVAAAGFKGWDVYGTHFSFTVVYVLSPYKFGDVSSKMKSPASIKQAKI